MYKRKVHMVFHVFESFGLILVVMMFLVEYYIWHVEVDLDSLYWDNYGFM